MTTQDQYLSVNGLQFRFREWGDSHKQAMLYFPVYTGLANETDAFAEIVSSRYRFIAVDSRGHGRSDWGPADDYTPNQYHADAVAIRDAIGLDKPILMGSSFGAATALRIAATEPERTAALIMDDQPPEAPAARTYAPLMKTYERQQDERFADIEAVTDWAFRFRGPTWGWNSLSRDTVRAWAEEATKELPDGHRVWRLDPEIYRCLAPFAGRPESDLRPLFSSVTVPMLVARRTTKGAGLLSPLWEELQTLNPRATYLTYETAGHPVVFTQPAALAEAVFAFLDKAGV